MTEVHWIARKDLVSAVTTEGYGYVFAREPRQQVAQRDRHQQRQEPEAQQPEHDRDRYQTVYAREPGSAA